MSKTHQRDSCIFYRSFYEAISELEEKSQAKVYNAIFEYTLNFNEVELSGMEKIVFTLIKPQLDANNKRYQSGLKPKKKQKVSKTEAKQKQDVSKSEANVNDNVNENDNVNDNVNENKNENKNVKGNNNDFIEQILARFKDAYFESFNEEYIVTNLGKERSAIGKLLKLHKEKNPDMNGEETLESFYVTFKKITTIKDKFLIDNYSPSIILNQLNKITKHFKNKNYEQTKGVTNEQIKNILQNQFGD